MFDREACPICQNIDGDSATVRKDFGTDQVLVGCPACGNFSLGREALYDHAQYLDDDQRRAISHSIRWRNELGEERLALTSASLEKFGRSHPLPSVPEQVDNLLNFLSLRLKHAGRFYKRVDPAIISAIGAFDRAAAVSLIQSMTGGGYVTSVDASTLSGSDVIKIAPTLSGWIRAGELAKGKASEPFAFMAMKYGDPALEAYESM